MRLNFGDSVILDKRRDRVGIVYGKEGKDLRVRVRAEEATVDVHRDDVELVAEVMAEAVFRGTKYANDFSYNGKSTLAVLVDRFGYVADYRLRQDTIDKVSSQLYRAGVELRAETHHREAAFWLTALV